MADLSPAHMQARTVLRQLQKYTASLDLPPSLSFDHPRLTLPPLPSFTQQERTLVLAWKAYLKWEEGNPLELEDKDPALITRVQCAYRKALVHMRFYSEIWLVFDRRLPYVD